MKRAGIYFFYDAEGIVDRYVEYYLKELKKVVDHLVVVVNGKLTTAGRHSIADIVDGFFVRENKGFDVWAYHDAIDYIGWDELLKYNELVLTNSTVFGPIYPFEEAFEKMLEIKCDFWGMQRRYEEKNMKTFLGKPTIHGYMPEFPLSNFWVIRSDLLHSYEFKKHWDRLPPINDYTDACIYHEPVFTKTMCDAGYFFATYDGEFQRNLCPSPTVQAVHEQVANFRVPIIRRRTFQNAYDEYNDYQKGCDASKVLKFIDENTNYDVNLIWENILRTTNQYDLKNRLHLNYILSKNRADEIEISNMRVAVIFHAYYTELYEKYLPNLRAFPEQTHIFIMTDSEEKRKKLVELSTQLAEVRCVEFILVQNQGRDVSSLLIGGKEIVLNGNYDLVCFMHDKKGAGARSKWECIGNAFSETCFNNVAGSPEYIHNVISLFRKNSRLGMAVPPPPSHGNYYFTIGGNWYVNFDNTTDLLKKLHCNVPICLEKPPVAPYGTVFWFRPDALRTLFEEKWSYEDFPLEPAPTDGTIMHAIERAYPLISQGNGYYPAVILNHEYAEQELTYMTYEAREYIQVSRRYVGAYPTSNALRAGLEYNLANCMKDAQGVPKLNTAFRNKRTPIISRLITGLANFRYKHIAKRLIPNRIWNILRKLKCKATGEVYVD
ncbi:rhamnan synthesis F family protein [Desulfitobacterium hafniense]|uniref:rhamnan synthesis F family protein n=1 Tax=Desulfitobacterium hafniense TaxID=49338 RepID=UPI00036D0367|nr:rhamnan synthesis F family protein [Desulfitobacterium hafniense]